jgi:phosphomannomutase/phosphoglucomutase
MARKGQPRRGSAGHQQPPRLVATPLPYLLAGLAVLALAAYLQFGGSAEARRSDNARSEAQALSESLRPPIVALQSLVRDPQTLELAAAALASPAKEAELRAFLQGRNPALVDVHIYDPQVFMIDLGSVGENGYILLDMMASAADQGVAPVQFIRPDGDALLTTAASVVSNEQLQGFVVLFADAGQLLQRFSLDSPLAGYVALEHRAGGNTPFRLKEVGAGPPVGFNLQRIIIPGSMFQVVVPQSSEVAVFSERQQQLLALIGVLLLLAGAYHWWANRRALARANAELSVFEPAPTGVDNTATGDTLKTRLANRAASRAADEKAKQDAMTQAVITQNMLTDLPHEFQKRNVPVAQGTETVELTSSIFRAYDIRGIVGETLDAGIARQVGRAVGSLALDSLAGPVVVGRDGRHSGPELVAGMIAGIRSTGCDVIDVGAVPTGVLYYACHELGLGTGVMVTGSHNPPDYNGFKIMIGGKTLSGDMIMGLYDRIQTGNLRSGEGEASQQDVLPAYIQRIASDIQLDRPLKVVADCGNGIGGACAADVLRAIGADVVPLYDEVDGDFPNHHPDPSEPENLSDLIEAVRLMDADLGVAFDGDADRLGVVTPAGEIVFADRVMMLYAQEVLSRNPGATIIFDVKCTGHLERIIREAGGVPEMYKTGHSLIKNRMKEVKAPFAGEMSGHFFFKDRWYGFDCGIYSAARLLEILASDERTPTQVLDALPNSVSTPELKVHLREGENHEFIEKFQAAAHFDGARLNTIDGVRADFDDGWGLVRASNTTPVLVLRFDADSQAALQRVQEAFREQLLAIKPDMKLPF